ncbi:MAG: metal ABC transporter permease [Kiloniellaceae bacterium]
MLDDFFWRALIGGVGVALVAGPLGCFIVWRRMAYFGDTMAHAALLGVALALLLDIHITLGVFAITAAVAFALVLLQRQAALPSDALLGILSHSTLALGLVLVAFMAWLRIDLLSYLFGDLLAVTRLDIALIYLGGGAALAVLALIWRPLLAGTVSAELAAAEALRPERARLVFMVLMAAVIAIAMKIVGILLITSLLVIPAATARRFAGGPEQMAGLAAGLGAAAVALGLFGSLRFDTPSGPSVVVAALLLFLASLLGRARRRRGAAPTTGGR